MGGQVYYYFITKSHISIAALEILFSSKWNDKYIDCPLFLKLDQTFPLIF